MLAGSQKEFMITNTNNIGKKAGPSIHPSDFAHELPDLSQYSLEDVVARFKDTEKRRDVSSEPRTEAEVLWPVRAAPRELLSSLNLAAQNLGVSRSVLTRCMSHQLVDWYANALGLQKLTGEYDNIYRSIKQQAYSTLRVQAENPPKFVFYESCEKEHTSISTIRWVSGVLSSTKAVLGMSAHDLLMIGLIWSLTTLANKDWDKQTVDKFFRPEVYNFETFLVDRKADIAALRMKYDYREKTHYNDNIFIKEDGQKYES